MKAATDHPVQELIAARWSPYSFAARAVAAEDLRSLFEAARWAPSSYNEQPWRYIVARQEQTADFQRLLSCLIDLNQVWAKAAPVLALGIARLRFSHNEQPNRAAIHDLGLANGYLVLEATARGLAVHQMIGILPDKAREIYEIPEGYEPMVGLAIGYTGDPQALPEELAKRDLLRRPRKPLRDFVFDGKWGSISDFVR
ncbi:MAG: nitroreductase family protein [Deltaproteobacteria bacterium]|nr:nitroreductase family protein [Deltaproteobacteria bacterium]